MEAEMSKIAFVSNPSGTGVFSIASPATNTDRTLTLPDVDGTVVTADTSGNVGIGTNSPLSTFEISAGANNTYMRINDTRASAPYVGSESGAMVFGIWGVGERCRISSSGNLLVGTTGVPNVGLGQTGFSVSPTELVFSSNTNGGNSLSYWRTQAGNSYVASYLNGNNNVGSIYVTSSSTSYNTSSDYRLKEDIRPVANASDRVLALKPCNFAWKFDNSRTDGFIAHEAQEIVPEAVTGIKDAVDADGKPIYQGIDQSKIVPLLTAALQEALQKIEALEARMITLEAKP
jgi:hypothetical protein